jgi:RNA polymerase sigma-70 factor (ECF subfamily)
MEELVDPVETERGLVLLAIGRDEAAFTSLYEMYHLSIRKYIYSLIKDWDNAEDISSQVFLKAWEAIERYQATRVPFLYWLRRIAYTTTVSWLRRQKVVHVPYEDISGQGYEDFQEVEREEEAQRLRQNIMRLSFSYRQVLMLRFMENMSYLEVAASLNKEVPTVRVLQHRALAKLKLLLREEDR